MKFSYSSILLNWTKNVVVFSLPLLLLTACPKPSEDFVGTEYVVAPADLQVISLGSTNESIDLTKDSVAFEGVLSHRVSWFIKLTGLESGAEATISGLSDTINPEKAFWKGNHSGLYFFREG